MMSLQSDDNVVLSGQINNRNAARTAAWLSSQPHSQQHHSNNDPRVAPVPPPSLARRRPHLGLFLGLFSVCLLVSWVFYDREETVLAMSWPKPATVQPPPMLRDRERGGAQGTPPPAAGQAVAGPTTARHSSNTNPTTLFSADDPKLAVRSEVDGGQQAKVAWIMSFGGSGTSYTIINVEQMSNATTASNYATEFNVLVPVHPNWTHGPFLRDPDKPLPNRYILTKTHCGGYCMDCGPAAYMFDSVQAFDVACRTAQLPNRQKVVYGQNIPQRAVHLIRNPFDNIVGRMHLAVKNGKSRTNNNNTTDAGGSQHQHHNNNNNDTIAVRRDELFTSSKEGLAHWCQYLDQKYASREQSPHHRPNRLDLYQQVPCHAEWYRYVQWHNWAYQVTTTLYPQMRTHYLYYDNYTRNWRGTVDALLDFLELPQQAKQSKPYEFITSGKSYRPYFSHDHTQLATKMVRELALPPVWALMKHYFHDPTNNVHVEQQTSARNPNVKADANKEGDTDRRDNENNDGDENTNEKKDKEPGNDDDDDEDRTVPKKNNGDSNRNWDTGTPDAVTLPRVAWLLSFPNSGTSYTLRNIERMTNTTTASNYARDWPECRPVRPNLTHGPFIHRPHMKLPPFYILTKTHCTGFCVDCHPRDYIVNSTASFQEGCLSGHTKDAESGAAMDTRYEPSIPVRVVHLIRNPFDNIVARMHLASKQLPDQGDTTTMRTTAMTLSRFAMDSKDDFAAWCAQMDAMHQRQEIKSSKWFPDNQIRQLFQDVPCHAEWYRYVQWHNYAVNMTRAQPNLPVHYLYYEQYELDHERTMQDLLAFLELKAKRRPVKFIQGKSYQTFFENRTALAAARLVRALATPATWTLLKPYFQQWQ